MVALRWCKGEKQNTIYGCTALTQNAIYGLAPIKTGSDEPQTLQSERTEFEIPMQPLPHQRKHILLSLPDVAPVPNSSYMLSEPNDCTLKKHLQHMPTQRKHRILLLLLLFAMMVSLLSIPFLCYSAMPS